MIRNFKILFPFIITFFLCHFASLAFSQSFLCTPSAQVALLPQQNGTWNGAGYDKFEPYDSFILRPPTEEDLSIMKDMAYLTDDYAFIVRNFGQPLILNACRYGFNSNGYLNCREGAAVLQMSFTNKRFVMHEGGDYLLGKNKSGESLTVGTCINN